MRRAGEANAAPQNIQFNHMAARLSAQQTGKPPQIGRNCDLANQAPMKFHLDEPQGGNSISRHDGQTVWVNGEQHSSSLLVPWSGSVQTWALDSFDVIMITTTNKRRDALRKAIAGKPGAHLWRFTTTADIHREDVLRAPILLRCDSDVPGSFIKPRSDAATAETGPEAIQ